MSKNRTVSSFVVDALEPRQLLAAWSVRMNFQPANAAVPEYCRADVGYTYALRSNGLAYGWSTVNTAWTRDRDAAASPDQRYDTLNHMHKAGNLKWEIAVPSAGQYSVRVVAGDAAYLDSTYRINVEGTLAVSGTPNASQRWFDATRTVTVTDGRLTISNASGAVNNKINFVEITQTSTIVPQPTGTIAWSNRAAHEVPRTEHMSVMVGGKLYLIGGYINNKYLSVARMDAYDPAANAWARLPDLPQKLSHAGTAADDRYIYLAGGYTVDSTGTRQVFGLKTVRRYDTVGGQWSLLPDLPQARGAGSMVLLGRTLYYMGGLDSRMNTYADVYALNLDATAPAWSSRASLPEPNNHFGAVVLEGRIYTVGGQSGNDNTAVFKKSCYRYDPVANKWSGIASLASPPRSHVGPSTIIHNGKIIVLGGETDGPAVGRVASVKAVEIYDPATNTWKANTSLPAGRSGGTAASWNGKLIFTTGLSFGVFCKDTWIGDFR